MVGVEVVEGIAAAGDDPQGDGLPGRSEGDFDCLVALAGVFHFVTREWGICGGAVGLNSFDTDAGRIVGEAGGLVDARDN